MKVLIVEDSFVGREYLLALLEETDATCIAVETGEEALEIFREAHGEGDSIDLVILDIVLPGMDGLQTLEKLRALEADWDVPADRACKVIMATALDDDTNATRAFFQGNAASYITKPITPDKLAAELHALGLPV